MTNSSKFDVSITEIELKYDATDISLNKFNEFAKSLNPQKFLEAASWDYYFENQDKASEVEFLRYRAGNHPELTMKIKKTDKNNNHRIEVDLPLANHVNEQDREKFVVEFCKQLGYNINFKIYKYCNIYWYEKLDMVMYLVYDSNMREKGRFIEIEARKDKSFVSEEEAWNAVKELEQKLSVLGLTPQNRMRKSQWELNKK